MTTLHSQLKRLTSSVSSETTTTLSMECCDCGNTSDVLTNGTVKEIRAFIGRLYRCGWRYMSCDALQVVGPFCPRCAKGPRYHPRQKRRLSP